MLAAGLLLGCSVISGEQPPVEKETFSRVLVELHAWTARQQLSDSLYRTGRDSIFAHYDVREADFQRTLDYYSRRPQEFETLYNGVIDTLSAISGRLQKREDPDAAASDASTPSGLDSLRQRRGGR
jgi:hypothetical protein